MRTPGTHVAQNAEEKSLKDCANKCNRKGLGAHFIPDPVTPSANGENPGWNDSLPTSCRCSKDNLDVIIDFSSFAETALPKHLFPFQKSKIDLEKLKKKPQTQTQAGKTQTQDSKLN